MDIEMFNHREWMRYEQCPIYTCRSLYLEVCESEYSSSFSFTVFAFFI